ncbi:transcriptional regulator with XRE-family HTH domain [Sphingobium sp. OAS761]|uniref:helix-turn-helix domain-containing protein n=1 Tax=Sphingobium sp. OAS761 TaxID=2817901 RepID=UPI0020A141A9|nr:helix-turn-helix domain-containing protein [Sphingobium sp. OAS761]MCP1471789.1 transcriptional regulator with XRE-family HTH domain [Sphingobium sp. OAS761]
MRSDSSGTAMLAVLRRHLRSDGWTATRLSGELGVSEATVKRWIAGRSLSLDRLDRLAGLCGMTIAELAREAELSRSGLVRELTLAQERALSADAFLSLLFMALLAGASPCELSEDFFLPRSELDAALARLERLALIDRLRDGRIRPLVDRTLIFRKAPMRTLFEKHMKQQFLAMDFAAPDAVYASELLKLSNAGMAELAEMMERFRRDTHQLAERDRERTLLQRHWVAMLCAIRPFNTAGLQDAQRDIAVERS